ncbi:glycosyltransferase family 2 protein, partial [bacterium]|nr:glycosyltransferase family 2 protein [bacterium]
KKLNSRAVIMPCYKSIATALPISLQCLKYADIVICVDDACPENTGNYIEQNSKNENILVIYHEENMGVGGATKTGIREAIRLGFETIIKIDSDGQADPKLIPRLAERVERCGADICKGNRFNDTRVLSRMPPTRLIGNAALSFITKASTGYWEIFDPTNGLICLRSSAIKRIHLDKTDNRYFFETDILFRAGLIDLIIDEISMDAVYEQEVSSLSPSKEILNFGIRHILTMLKRIAYQYLLLDFNPGSISLIVGTIFMSLSCAIGINRLTIGLIYGETTSSGTLTLFLGCFLAGSQFIIGFAQYDSSQRVLMRQLKRNRFISH